MKTLFTTRNFGLKLIIMSLTMTSFINPVISQTTHHVEVTSNVFTPSNLMINVGDKVVWTNTQGNHNVNGLQSAFPSNPESFGNDVAANWTFEHIFNMAGSYDYQCDPHIDFGMLGTVTVNEMESNMLTLNFSGMTPHIGQSLSLVLRDKDNGQEIARKHYDVIESFSAMVHGLEMGHSYEIDFYSDHNGNGHYDAPPADHAWRMDLDNVSGDEILNFSHNTEFKDVEWEHMAYVNFSGMTPHLGQELFIALYDETMGMEVDRESIIVTESFTVALGKLMAGNTYRLDFFSDHNGNHRYDNPPNDHSWKLNIAEANGDEMLNFSHNTNFSDLAWKYKLTLRFSGMNPHQGQKLMMYLKDIDSDQYVDTVELSEIVDVEFDLESFMLMPGSSYVIDFYADHNGNGIYDAPPTDHAWRIDLPEVEGDTKVEFTHNTAFTDIFASPTGLSDIDLNSIRIYPNPSQGIIYIDTKDQNLKLSSFKVYSLSGAMLMEETGPLNNNLSIDLSYLNSGYYFIELKADEKTERFKVIKQ